MSYPSLRGAVALLGMSLGISVPASAQFQQAQPQRVLRYEVTELPDLGSLFHIAHVFDLNDHGEAVGYVLNSQLQWRAVHWNAASVVTDLGGPGTTWSIARGISANGVIGGFHGPTVQDAVPVLWVNGTIVPLGNPAGGDGVEAFDVNDNHVAVGRGHNGTDSFAVRWNASGATAIAAPFSYAFAINENGLAAGFATLSGFPAATMWRGGSMTVLPNLGLANSKAIGVNGQGTIVGHAGSPITGLAHGVAWSGGTIVDLGAYQGTYLSTATGINDHGLIVGYFYLDPLSEITRAMLWTPSGVAYNLNDLIPANSGWTLSTAEEVNDSGWIVGIGTREGFSGTRAYVAKPR